MHDNLFFFLKNLMKNSHHAQIDGKWEQCLYLFYEKNKLHILSQLFLWLSTHFSHFDFQTWVWTKTGTLWHFFILMHLSNPFWGKFGSSVLSFTWKKIFLSTTKNFLTAHRIFVISVWTYQDDLRLAKFFLFFRSLII